MLRATCQCGAVVLEVDRKPESLTICNCTICRRYGTLWAYYTRKSARVVSGMKSLAFYTWQNHEIEFYHCTTCGCVTHWERAEKEPDSRVGVNARNFDPESVAATKIRILDGAESWKTLDEYVQPDLFVSPYRKSAR
jgi:hypothetical protein